MAAKSTETDEYRSELQWYEVRVMSGRVVITSHLTELRVDHKLMPRPAIDLTLGEILLVTLESFPVIPKFMTET